MNGSVVKRFRAEDAYALSTEAGWNQTIADWQRILTLSPDGCFGIEVDGRLVATAVATVYDKQLAWIGMVITAESERGKGHARKLMRMALDHVDALGVACCKLDATDLGRPVYAKLGFVEERPVARFVRVAQTSPLFVHPIDDPFGADRSALLKALVGNERYTVPGQAFAYARPGRLAWHFGPCVAKQAADAADLLHQFLTNHAEEPSILDLFPDNGVAVEMAHSAGYEPVRHLTRMLRGDLNLTHLGWHPDIYALSGFEYG